jgi:diacylglycerol kinase family enzyme
VRARDVPVILSWIVRGNGYADWVMTGHDLDRVEVRCDRPLPVQADGEDLGDFDNVVFEARRDAVSVLV